MIGVLAQGRMGNQMFQFAFGYIAAAKLNTSFFLYKPTSLHYFKLFSNFETINSINYKKYAQRLLFKKSALPFPKLNSKNKRNELFNWAVYKNIISWPNQLEGNQYLLSQLQDNVLYDGYFQSEKYYEKHENKVRELFSLKEDVIKDFEKNKSTILRKKYIAVHLRRTDYINHGAPELGGYDMTLPLSFYEKSLALIPNKDEYNVVFVSDDISFIKQKFGEQSNYYYENNSEIVDFQILLNADKLIIANSSFSWWAAWLNNNPNLAVYAPKYFLGFKVNKYYPAGIDVKKWNWIDVN